MPRWSSPFVVAVLVATAGGAAAENKSTFDPPNPNLPADAVIAGRRDFVPTPHEGFAPRDSSSPHESMISPWLYLNRCTGGCSITTGSTNDAKTLTTRIGTPGSHTLEEFINSMGQKGASADAEWNQLVQCMKEVYSPFGVMVTDQVPPGGVSYTMAVIAGKTGDIGYDNCPANQCCQVLGVAPLDVQGCQPFDNVMSFSFASCHGGSGTDRIENLCWTAAQETAHAFGLDHEFQFADGSSACNDPMTYRFDCGGQKFFRNKPAQCGENTSRTCICGGSQNSHQSLLDVFGPGMSIVAAPTATILLPATGASVQKAFAVQSQAGSKRGVDKVELWLNNHKWAERGGVMFGANGQPNPAVYSFTAPTNLPDGVIDIVIKAYDDLGIKTDSTMVTVTKGAPCADAGSCLKGQKCEAGKCFWDPATGAMGDACTYNEFCLSGVCSGPADDLICTTTCTPNIMGTCPPNYECAASGNSGVCVPATDSGGCCSVGRDSSAVWMHMGLGAAVLGLLSRRRRK